MTETVLVAGVGHRLWRDLSAGITWMNRLRELSWPAHVVIEDFGFGAIAMMQQLEDTPFDRAIFLGAETRARPPGTLHVSRYFPHNPAPELVQAHMAEAGGGVVTIDSLLVIIEHFGVLPRETWVVEVEPEDRGWGEGESATVAALFSSVVEHVRTIVGPESGPLAAAGVAS